MAYLKNDGGSLIKRTHHSLSLSYAHTYTIKFEHTLIIPLPLGNLILRNLSQRKLSQRNLTLRKSKNYIERPRYVGFPSPYGPLPSSYFDPIPYHTSYEC